MPAPKQLQRRAGCIKAVHEILAVDVPKLPQQICNQTLTYHLTRKTPALLELQSGGIKTARKLLGIAAEQEFGLNGSLNQNFIPQILSPATLAPEP